VDQVGVKVSNQKWVRTVPNWQITIFEPLLISPDPPANWTQLEYWDDAGEKPYLQEYKGQGLLKDKAVLITGADSGIGRSVAILMAREGADISFVYLPEEESDAQETKRYIEKAGRKAHLMPMDITVEANCKKMIDEHMQVFGKLSVLVNNAAMQEFGRLW